jgi:hypothetical protein
MSQQRQRGFWIIAVLLFACARVSAHPVAQGSMSIQISSNKIVVQARVSMEEVFVQSALSAAKDSKLTIDELCRRHGDYLLLHLHLFADDKPLTGFVRRVTSPRGPGPQRALYDFEYELAATPARVRVNEDVLNEFDYAPGNRWEATYVTRVDQEGQPPVEGLLLTSREPLVIDCTGFKYPLGTASASATIDKWRLTQDYVRHGILHILNGWDHLLFISALVLAVVTLWDLVKVITAFTLAHSITLTLSVLNLVRLPGKIVEPMIAASIVFVALQNIFWLQRSRGASRLGVAYVFGLLHGLGLAGGLLDAMEGMASLTIGLAIVAFSVGIEIGHQVVVVPIFALLKLLRSRHGTASHFAHGIFRYGSAAICLTGLVYLIAALRS